MRFEAWLEKNSGNGAAFEHLTKRFFVAEPNIAHVWMWEEYPDRDGADMGIDLVVENKDGQRWAVQCKNYTNTITWGDIATFAGASTEFERKILVSSRPGVTNNAHKQMQRLGIEHYGPEVFDNFNCHVQAKNKPKKTTLRPYQKQAVKACEGVQRGILHMPTGSGKTVVLSRIAGTKNTLFVVPSISLASQTARAFLADDPSRRAIIVCSDSTTGKEDENWAGVPVCRTVEEILQYPDHSVFVTMNSLHKVVASKHQFEIVLVDEAHRLAKSGDMGKEIWGFNLPTIFATATPKVLHEDLKDDPRTKHIPSMDDEELFGPVVFSVTIRELIDAGYLSDYQVDILAVREREIAELVSDRAFLQDGDKILGAEDAAFYVGLEKAADEYGVSRIITYHSRVNQAEQAASHFRKRGYSSRAISAKTPDYQRRIILDELRHGGIVTNARTLQEGIDVPSLDAVCFASPKYSKVDIVQSVGRALRLDPENPQKVGHIILPVVVSEDDNAELVLENSRFQHIYTVLQHLADEDELLRAEIEQIKMGKGAPTGVVGGTPKITVVDIMAQLTLESFADKIRLHAVRPAGPTAQERVEAFVKEHGRLPKQKLGRSRHPEEYNLYAAFSHALHRQAGWAKELRRIYPVRPSAEERVLTFVKDKQRLPKGGKNIPTEERRLYDSLSDAHRRGHSWAVKLYAEHPTRFSIPAEKRVKDFCAESGRLPRNSKRATDAERSTASRLAYARKKGEQWAIDLYEEYKDKG